MAKKQPISIGDLSFGTKEEAKTYIKGILHRYDFHSPFNNEDFLFMQDLLRLHPEYSEKVGNGVASIMIRPDLYGVNKQFYITRVDGSETEFSYAKCLSQKEKNKLALFKEAARHAVRGQIVEYREAYFMQNQNQEEKVICLETGEAISRKQSNIDHHPTSFDSIALDFIELEGIDVDNIRYGGFGDNEQDRLFEDETIAERFSKYHKEKAQFRVVTIGVNLTKKKK